MPQACLLDEDGNVAFVGETPAVRGNGGNGDDNADDRIRPVAPLALLHDHDIDLLTRVSDLAQAAEIAQTADDTADAEAAVRLHWQNG
ncbi:hypothetical protein, partial [Klebsiella pneumoniae]|uniref:hypothetical protein n=1 Tax=Klebsiella pneumoniae TaxID=573 RepID=UPI003B5BF335